MPFILTIQLSIRPSPNRNVLLAIYIIGHDDSRTIVSTSGICDRIFVVVLTLGHVANVYIIYYAVIALSQSAIQTAIDRSLRCWLLLLPPRNFDYFAQRSQSSYPIQRTDTDYFYC